MAIEIVDLPIEHGDLNHSYVTIPGGISTEMAGRRISLMTRHWLPYDQWFIKDKIKGDQVLRLKEV